jgi:hypothetical protein
MLDKVDPVHDFLVAWEKEGPLNGNKSLDRASYMLRAETNKHLNGKFLLVEINHPGFGDAEFQAALTKVHREQFRRTNPALYDVLQASSDPDVEIPACYHSYMLYSLNGTRQLFADEPIYGEERLADLPWFVGPNAQSITVFQEHDREDGQTLVRVLNKMQWRGRKPRVIDGF